MGKIHITNDDKKEFKSTANGAKKAIWMIVGMIIDFLGTLGISLLYIFSNKISNDMCFFGILFVLLVIIVLGGELIGVYYGSLEQFVYHKNNKKVLDINE